MVGTIVDYKLGEYVIVLSGEKTIGCKWTKNLESKMLIGRTAEIKRNAKTAEIKYIWEE